MRLQGHCSLPVLSGLLSVPLLASYETELVLGLGETRLDLERVLESLAGIGIAQQIQVCNSQPEIRFRICWALRYIVFQDMGCGQILSLLDHHAGDQVSVVQFRTLTLQILRSLQSLIVLPSLHGFNNQVTQRSEEHTSELQSPCNLVCRLL